MRSKTANCLLSEVGKPQNCFCCKTGSHSTIWGG
jgi:hypothetical protein